jgi:hypothetical protein
MKENSHSRDAEDNELRLHVPYPDQLELREASPFVAELQLYFLSPQSFNLDICNQAFYIAGSNCAPAQRMMSILRSIHLSTSSNAV